MQLPQGATVAVSDGEKLHLFKNAGDEAHPQLIGLAAENPQTENSGSGSGHHNSSANPGHGQAEEDNFAAGTAALLNRGVLDGKITNLVVIAAPRTLGELRKHYHKSLAAVLVGEIPKDLTGHSLADVQHAINAA